jgi:hypothetical protein
MLGKEWVIMKEKVLNFAIWFVTLAAGALLTEWHYRNQRISAIRKERFLGLYRPFMQMAQTRYCVDEYIPFSEISEEIKRDILKLLTDKDYLATREIQERIYSLSKIYLWPDDQDKDDHINAAFDSIYDAIKKEYVALCEKLRYTPTF